MAGRVRVGLMRGNSHIPELDAAGLRRFGLLTGAMFAVVFGGALPLLFGDGRLPVWPWGVFATLSTIALVAPLALRSVYTAWMRLGLLLNRLTTPVIMAVVFFGFVTPFGFVRRLLGRPALRFGLREPASSYRVPSRKPSTESLERPF